MWKRVYEFVVVLSTSFFLILRGRALAAEEHLDTDESLAYITPEKDHFVRTAQLKKERESLVLDYVMILHTAEVFSDRVASALLRAVRSHTLELIGEYHRRRDYFCSVGKAIANDRDDCIGLISDSLLDEFDKKDERLLSTRDTNLRELLGNSRHCLLRLEEIGLEICAIEAELFHRPVRPKR